MSETLSVACPHCGATYNIANSMAGKSVRCKTCQQTFPVAASSTNDGDGQGTPTGGSQWDMILQQADAHRTQAERDEAEQKRKLEERAAEIRKKNEEKELRKRLGKQRRENVASADHPFLSGCLPAGIVIFFVVLPCIGNFLAVFQSPNPMGHMALVAVSYAALFLLIVPASMIGISVGAEMRSAELPEGMYFRTLATVCIPSSCVGAAFIMGYLVGSPVMPVAITMILSSPFVLLFVRFFLKQVMADSFIIALCCIVGFSIAASGGAFLQYHTLVLAYPEIGGGLEEARKEIADRRKNAAEESLSRAQSSNRRSSTSGNASKPAAKKPQPRKTIARLSDSELEALHRRMILQSDQVSDEQKEQYRNELSKRAREQEPDNLNQPIITSEVWSTGSSPNPDANWIAINAVKSAIQLPDGFFINLNASSDSLSKYRWEQHEAGQMTAWLQIEIDRNMSFDQRRAWMVTTPWPLKYGSSYSVHVPGAKLQTGVIGKTPFQRADWVHTDIATGEQSRRTVAVAYVDNLWLKVEIGSILSARTAHEQCVASLLKFERPVSDSFAEDPLGMAQLAKAFGRFPDAAASKMTFMGSDVELYLLPYLTHKSEEVRSAAYRVLDRKVTDRSADELLKICFDPEAPDRTKALDLWIYATRLDSDEALTAVLQAIIPGVFPTYRSDAFKLLAGIEPIEKYRDQVAASALDAVENGNDTWGHAVRCLSRWSTKSHEDLYLKLIESDRSSAAEAAAEAFGPDTSDQTVAKLAGMMEAGNDNAARALISVGEKAESQMLAVVKRSDSSRVLSNAISILEQVGGRQTLFQLSRIKDHLEEVGGFASGGLTRDRRAPGRIEGRTILSRSSSSLVSRMEAAADVIRERVRSQNR